MKIAQYTTEKEQLKGEYLKKFNEIEYYGQIHMVNEDNLAEKMMDLVDLFLEAQENGKPAEFIIGNDIGDFCENFYSDITKKDMIKSVLESFRVLLWEVFFIGLLSSLIGETGDGLVLAIMVGAICGLVGSIIANVIGATLLKHGKCSTKKMKLLEWPLRIGLTIAAFVIVIIMDVELTMLEKILWMLSAGGLLFYYFMNYWYRYKMYGSFRKPKNAYSTTFWGLVTEGVDIPKESNVKMIARLYEKTNRKRRKKGENPMNTEEFFAWMEKRNKKYCKVTIPAAFGVGMFGGESMPSTYAHYRMGKEIQNQLYGSERRIIDKYPELFYIGLHGPDIFFYYKPFGKNRVNQTGYALHDRSGAEFFTQAAGVIRKHGNYEQHLAYMYGFICHFALDVTCHGYIDEKIELSGVSHAEIEVEFDRKLMILDGKDPVRQVLTDHIQPDRRNAFIIKDFFEGFTEDQVQKSLEGMIFYNRVLLAPSKWKRGALFLAMRVAGVYPLLHGLVVNYKKNPACEDSNQKLMSLYFDAQTLALRLIQEYLSFVEEHTPLDEIYHNTFGGKPEEKEERVNEISIDERRKKLGIL